MTQRNTYRPSLERFNAPFRGTTRREDTVNFDLAVMHDLTHLAKISGELEVPGHRTAIDDNFAAIYTSEGDITSHHPSAGQLVTRQETLPNMEPTKWTPLTQATIKKTPGWSHYTLAGTLHQSGIKKVIQGHPGDIITIRFAVNALHPGVGGNFAVGSSNLLQDMPDLTYYSADDFRNQTQVRYVEKRLLVETQQQIDLVVYAVHGSEFNSILQLHDFSVSYYKERLVKATGLDSHIKQETSRLHQEIGDLANRITSL